MLSGIPESKIRIVGGDIGGGFGNKVPVYPGYVVRDRRLDRAPACRSSGSSRASTTSRPPASPATTTASASSRPTSDGRIKALRFTALADHGAFNSHVSATKLPGRAVQHLHRLLRHPEGAIAASTRVYTNKAPGGVAYRCSLRVTEAVYLIERMIDVLAQKLGIDKAEIRRRNFVKAEQFPYTTRARLDARQRQLPDGARQGAGGGRLRGPAPRAGGEAADPKRRADGHRHLRPSPRSSAPGRPRSATSSASACSTAARSASIRPAAPSRASAR